MSPLNFLLNILWLIFGGLLAAVAWVIAALIMAITIIGIPWCFSALRIALYTFLPFGQEMRSRPDAGVLSVFGNIIWFVFAGWWLAIIHLVLALGLAISIIGIPFAWAHLKSAGAIVAPVCTEIVPRDSPRPVLY